MQSTSYLLLIAATVVCITALALLIVAEDFPCWCLRPLLQGLGALSQAQIAVQPHQLACARCGQAVPAVALHEEEVTPVLLTA